MLNTLENKQQLCGMTDNAFNELIPDYLRAKIKQHFTPDEVIQRSAEFLCSQPNTSVLDIGSGVGKFCLMAALRYPECNFYGIEIRDDLFTISNDIKKALGVRNAEFILGDVRNVPLHDFQHFYLFNPFHENIETENAIDEAMVLNEKKYLEYSGYIYRQLKRLPSGTRVASFHMPEASFPETYLIRNAFFDDHLLLLEKL